MSQSITVFYKWTAKEGNGEQLKSIYEQVCQEMQDAEPGTQMMQYYYDEDQEALIVHDLFANGEALGFHLGVTAAKHFQQLASIAVPGPFFFCGDVPEDLKQAAIGMNMGAEFSSHLGGFER